MSPIASAAAILLAGGRSRRMQGPDKPALISDGVPLLALALEAVGSVPRLVVVGPERPGIRLPDHARLVREDPPFAGPAAALAAGVAALASGTTDGTTDGEDGPVADDALVVVLATDLPRVRDAVPLLTAATPGRDGIVAVDASGRRQPLLARYRLGSLRSAIGAADGTLVDAPLRLLVDGLDLTEAAIDDALLADVDTPEDARRLGVTTPADRTA